MKYDDIILECKGDCDVCDVYLECQYQTSSGDEKQHYLEALIERDSKPGQEEVTATVIEPEVEAEVETQVETAAEVETEPEAVETSEESQEVIEEAQETIEEVEEEVAKEEIKEITEEEVTIEKPEEVQEVIAETDTETTDEVIEEVTDDVQEVPIESDKAVTPISEEEVAAIYAQIFNINNEDATIEDDTAIENVEETEAIQEIEPETICEVTDTATEEPCAQEEPDEVTQEVIADEEIPAVLEEVSEEETQEVVVDNAQEVEPEETAAEEIQPEVVQEEKLTPPTKEQVDEIYAEVFNLNNLQAVEESEEVQEIALETSEAVEELPVQEETTETEKVQEVVDDNVQEVVTEEIVAEEVQTEVQEVATEVIETETQPSVADEVQGTETEAPVEAVVETAPETATETPAEPVSETTAEVSAEPAPVKEVFKLTPPENNEELMANMCAKRARKLIYKPSEALITASFKVLGTDKKNDIGEKIKDILDAEIKQGVKVGYLDKFDGLSSSEIKEEYENDIVYEFAEQEFKKTGVIYDGKKIKVYIYDWDGKACHHVGYVDTTEAADFIPYLTNKEEYSFDVCGIITGGKGKRVVKEGSTLKIIKEKGDPIGLDVDIAVIKRKD